MSEKGTYTMSARNRGIMRIMSFPAKPRYSVRRLEAASVTLVDPQAAQTELDDANEILKRWRAAHAGPINTFQSTLRSKARHFYRNAIVAQRLKRAPTIIGKLHRMGSRGINLATMQDIAGVRAVLGTVSEVEALRDYYVNHPTLTHKLAKQNDYIARPKPDGYRGIHLIYKYNLNRPIARGWNGLLIEIQLRTELQHYWATAVEVVGTILGDPFKFGGDSHPEWREFFKLVSCAFAHLERRPAIQGYRNLSKEEIFRKVADQEKQLDALQRMEYFSMGFKHIRDKGSRQNKYHILSLDATEKVLTVSSFTELGLAKASEAYAGVEKQGDKNIDTVLVSTARTDDLKRAYPNYFLDVSDFASRVRKITDSVQ